MLCWCLGCQRVGSTGYCIMLCVCMALAQVHNLSLFLFLFCSLSPTTGLLYWYCLRLELFIYWHMDGLVCLNSAVIQHSQGLVAVCLLLRWFSHRFPVFPFFFSLRDFYWRVLVLTAGWQFSVCSMVNEEVLRLVISIIINLCRECGNRYIEYLCIIKENINGTN